MDPEKKVLFGSGVEGGREARFPSVEVEVEDEVEVRRASKVSWFTGK